MRRDRPPDPLTAAQVRWGTMGGMRQDARAGGAEPAAVRLHLHRGIGWGIYGTLTIALFVLCVVATVANLSDGRYGIAALIAVVGLALTAFLGLLTHSMVVPALTVRAAGVSGRMPAGNTVDVGWPEVTIEADEARPDSVRLDIAEQQVWVGARSWIGFPEFVVLVASTPAAAARLTPAARREVARLLQITD